MKEIEFIKENASKWKEFESIINKRKKVDPDFLADLYIQLTDDLSYAQTFYPESKIVHFLNQLTLKVHQKVYKHKKIEKNKIVSFWLLEYPQLIRKHFRELRTAFMIFIFAIVIGAVSSAHDKSFVRLILGDRYIKMTQENIKKGDPMAVYKQVNEVNMFLGITINNIRVALLAFAFGVLFSFGTAYVLFINGVMLGAFHYFFYERDLLLTSISSVWIHGTLEISAIIISGCAGIVIGNSLLFPRTYSRIISFRKGAKEGLQIVMGVVPIIIVAGFLEGFVTRYTNMPQLISFTIIFVSLCFVLWYFIFYPILVEMRLKSLKMTPSEKNFYEK